MTSECREWDWPPERRIEPQTQNRSAQRWIIWAAVFVLAIVLWRFKFGLLMLAALAFDLCRDLHDPQPRAQGPDPQRPPQQNGLCPRPIRAAIMAKVREREWSLVTR
jgi:hypothetical protein